MNQDAERLIALLSGREINVQKLGDLDWERIIGLAQKNSVAPVLFASLKSKDVTPPLTSAERIRKIYLTSAARNTRIFHEVGKILRALQAANIPVIPLKGIWLAESVYGNIALRSMGDVDLWVARSQLDAARQVMHSLGYSSRSKTNRPQALQDALGGETQMFKTNAPMVELHWNVFPGEWLRHTARIDEQVIWQRTLPHSRENVRRLSAEDAIIHICVHLAVNHQMSDAALRTLVDLDYARQRLKIDWSIVVRRARAWRVSSATWLVLQTLADLFGDPEKQLPLPDLAPASLRRLLLRRFVPLRLVVEGLRISSGPKRFLFLLALVDDPVDAIRLLWRAFFPDRIWLTLRYGLQDAPAWRIYLQRLWHPLRIAFQRDI